MHLDLERAAGGLGHVFGEFMNIGSVEGRIRVRGRHIPAFGAGLRCQSSHGNRRPAKQFRHEHLFLPVLNFANHVKNTYILSTFFKCIRSVL